MTPRDPDPEELDVPADLARGLRALVAPPAGVDPEVNRAVLSAARNELGTPARRRLRLIPLAAAALVLTFLWLGTRSRPIPGDVDRDGRVDALDAYLLARALRSADPDVDHRADVDGDGRVDQRDVERLLDLAVRLDG